MPWRTEPEVSTERQRELAEHRDGTTYIPDISTGQYPFKDVSLSRADIEWLLHNHENGRGPVQWEDKRQRGRVGLDLRGALLNGIDLTGLPLARMLGGFTVQDTSMQLHCNVIWSPFT